MAPNETVTRLLGIFDHPGALLAAAQKARAAGCEIIDVYSPTPLHEIMDIVTPRKSGVRFLTFAGALAGFVAGCALALGTSLVWNLVVGGKPVTSIIPFIVVPFELTILFGALATLLALLVLGRLPRRSFPDDAYRPEFSEGQFGLWIDVTGSPDRALNILSSTGALSIDSLRSRGRKGPRA